MDQVSAGVKTAKTFCRNCTSLCGLEIDVQDNRIVDVRGDKEHPVSRGYLCIKGKLSQELHSGQDRLPGTLKRDAEGSFVPIANSSAFDEIAETLNRLRDRYGPRSIAMFTGTGMGFGGLAYSTAKAWLKGIGSPEFYSSMTIDQSAKWVTIGRMGAFATGKPAIQDLDVMMIVGNNPMVSHLGTPASPIPPSNARQWIRDAKRRGLKMIVIDPRLTETARMADLHLPVRPGQDAVLMAAMIRIVLENGWEDRAFCSRFVRSVDTLHAAVKDFTVDHASRMSGLAPDLIEAAARMFGTSRRRSISSGTGANMSAHSNLAEHLLEALNAICGGYRKAGDPIRANGALYGLVPIVETVVPPDRTWETSVKCRSANAGLIFGEFPTSRLPDEILRDSDDRIRALICVGGNPAKAIGDTGKVVSALESLDLLVAIDFRMTQTARLADYVISTKLPYEREDLTGNSDNWFYKNFTQYTPAIVSPPADTPDDWEVFWELGHRMNTPIHLKKLAYGFPYDALPPGMDLDMTNKPSTHELLTIACSDARIALEEIEPHASGLEFPDTGFVTAAEADDGSRLDVCPDDVAAEIRALHAMAPPRRDQYKYLLTCRRMLHVMNTAFHTSPQVKRLYPTAPVFMHPDDIADEGLAAGSLVEIRSRHGAVVGLLSVDKTLLRGVVSMPHGWGQADADDRLNALTCRLVSLDEDLESINYMPLQSGIQVNVCAVSEESLA